MPRAKNGSLTKIGVVWQKSDFWTKHQNFGPKKRGPLLDSNHVLATTGKSYSKKKFAFSQIDISLLRNFGCFSHRRCSSSHNSLRSITHPVHPYIHHPTFCSESHQPFRIAFQPSLTLYTGKHANVKAV